MPWIVGGAVLGGALLSSQANKDAAGGQSDAARAASAEQARQFDISRRDLEPWRTSGTAAQMRLSDALGLRRAPTGPATEEQIRQLYQRYMGRPVGGAEMATLLGSDATAADFERMLAGSSEHLSHVNTQRDVDPVTTPLFAAPGEMPQGFGDLSRRFRLEDFENDPVNQIQGRFALDEGTKAIERRALASGNYDSGGTLKALTRYASEFGNQRAGESRARFVGDQTDQFNRLASVAGIGQTAATQTATLGANAATNIGNNMIGAANARGAAGVASANAFTGGLNTGLNYYQGQQFLNRLQPQVQTPAWNPFATGDFPMQSPMA